MDWLGELTRRQFEPLLDPANSFPSQPQMPHLRRLLTVAAAACLLAGRLPLATAADSRCLARSAIPPLPSRLSPSPALSHP